MQQTYACTASHLYTLLHTAQIVVDSADTSCYAQPPIPAVIAAQFSDMPSAIAKCGEELPAWESGGPFVKHNAAKNTTKGEDQHMEALHNTWTSADGAYSPDRSSMLWLQTGLALGMFGDVSMLLHALVEPLPMCACEWGHSAAS